MRFYESIHSPLTTITIYKIISKSMKDPQKRDQKRLTSIYVKSRKFGIVPPLYNPKSIYELVVVDAGGSVASLHSNWFKRLIVELQQ